MNRLKEEIIRNLNSSADACRLFHGRGESFEGLSHICIDFFEPTVLITAYKESKEGLISSIETSINEVLRDRAQNILLQKRFQKLAPTEILKGEIEENKIVSEEALNYHLNLGQHQNIGFFLDMKEVRSYLRKRSKDKKILNLFSYTGSFSVAAIEGGASFSANFDLSKNSLNTARKNHQLNNHDTRKVKFLAHDILKSFGKMNRLGPFDFIVLDPPSDQGSSFKVERDYLKVVRRLEEFLTEGGEVIACLNSPFHSHDDLHQIFVEHAPRLKFVEKLYRPESFMESDEDRGLKVRIYRKQ